MRKFKLSLGSTIHFCVSTSLFTFVPLQPVECDLWSIIWWGLMKNNQPLLETIKIFVIKSLWILNNPYIGTFYAIILIVVIELRGGVQLILVWNHTHDFKITSMISDQNCTTRSSITTLLHPFLNHSFFWICIGPHGWFVKSWTGNAFTLYMSTKQNDRCHFTKTHWSAKETRVNFIHANAQAWVLKSCYCKKLIAFFKV